MSKTLYDHHIKTIKGDDYVLFEDYNELQEKLEKEKEYKKFYENMYLASEDMNKQFRNMNKYLIERIDKAINYIENNSYSYVGLEELEVDNLLKILKGSDINE